MTFRQRSSHFNTHLACVALLLVSGLGCSARTSLAPLPGSLEPAILTSTLNSIKRFDQSTGLVSLSAIQTKDDGTISQTEIRFGFRVNRTGRIRIDLYPKQGFVTLASAVITERNIILLDHVEKVGIESEQIRNTLSEVFGFSPDRLELIMLLTGRLPHDLPVDFPLGAKSPIGSFLLRDARNQTEIEVIDSEICRITRTLNESEVLDATREDGHIEDQAFGAAERKEKMKDGKEKIKDTVNFSISHLSFSRPVEDKAFTLDTTGYKMRRRFN